MSETNITLNGVNISYFYYRVQLNLYQTAPYYKAITLYMN